VLCWGGCLLSAILVLLYGFVFHREEKQILVETPSPIPFSAEKLDAETMFRNGMACAHAGKRGQALKDAVSWLWRAGAKGHAEAQFQHAKLVCESDIFPNKRAAAVVFYAASMAGHRGASFRLGELYLNGGRGFFGPVQALSWFEIAVRRGDSCAIQLRDALSWQLDADQVSLAIQVADAAEKKIPVDWDKEKKFVLHEDGFPSLLIEHFWEIWFSKKDLRHNFFQQFIISEKNMDGQRSRIESVMMATLAFFSDYPIRPSQAVFVVFSFEPSNGGLCGETVLQKGSFSMKVKMRLDWDNNRRQWFVSGLQ